MIARVTLMSIIQDKLDEAIRLFQESVVPAAKSQNGFRGAYFLTNRETGEGLSITLWMSADDGKANEESGYYQEQLSKFKSLVKALPTFDDYYEVMAALKLKVGGYDGPYYLGVSVWDIIGNPEYDGDMDNIKKIIANKINDAIGTDFKAEDMHKIEEGWRDG